MNILHFRQRRGYLEDFMNKVSLYRIASEVKLMLFSPFWQVAPTLAYSFVPNPPISIRYGSKHHENRQIHPHLCDNHLWSYQNARISSKFGKTAEISQFWWFLGYFKSISRPKLCYTREKWLKTFEINTNWSVHVFQADAKVINLVKPMVKFDVY